MVSKHSFLMDLLGEDSYENSKEFSRIAIPISTVVLIILYLLSNFFHSGIISYFVGLTNGLSLIFITYVALWIVLLDIRVVVDEPERMSWEKTKVMPKPLTYKLTAVWTILLVVLGICAIYFSDKYRNQYEFECDSFLVDQQSQIYHFDWTECETSESSEHLDEMQGYQINESFTLCEECKIIAEDAAD